MTGIAPGRFLVLVGKRDRWELATTGGRLIVTSDPERVALVRGQQVGPPPLIGARVIPNTPHVDLDDWIHEKRAASGRRTAAAFLRGLLRRGGRR